MDARGIHQRTDTVAAGRSNVRIPRAVGATGHRCDAPARLLGPHEPCGPSIRDAAGSGSQRLYSFADIVAVRVIKRLLDAGVSLQNVRVAVQCLRCRGGQGVFGIAIGHTTTDIAAAVVGLPPVKPPVAEQDSASNALVVDVLSARRSA